MNKKRPPSSKRPRRHTPADDARWADLRRLTAARIGLKRTGASLATGPLLDFKLAHARARDAVHEPLDEKQLIGELAGLRIPVLHSAGPGEQPSHHLVLPGHRRRRPAP